MSPLQVTFPSLASTIPFPNLSLAFPYQCKLIFIHEFILFFMSCVLCQAQVRPMWAPEETEERVVPAFKEPTIL